MGYLWTWLTLKWEMDRISEILSLTPLVKQFSKNHLSKINTKFPLKNISRAERDLVTGLLQTCPNKKSADTLRSTDFCSLSSMKFIIWPKSFHHPCQVLKWHSKFKLPKRAWMTHWTHTDHAYGRSGNLYGWQWVRYTHMSWDKEQNTQQPSGMGRVSPS